MSKSDNLNDFLKDIANAIREKKGTTDLINPQNFSDEILSIKGGDSSGEEDSNTGDYEVKFIDYDGTVLKVARVNASESVEPPHVPTHDYLTFNEWIGDYTNITEDRIIGARHSSSDGRTHFHHSNGDYVQIHMRNASNTEVTINWGDGISEKVNAYVDGGIDCTHKYTDGKQHWITIYTTSTDMIYYSNSKQGEIINIDSIILGNDVSVLDCYFNYIYSLKSIVYPLTAGPINYLQYCPALTAIFAPSNATTVISAYYCDSLSYVILSSTMKYAPYIDGSNISSIYLPSTITTIGSNAFQNCRSLKSINIPTNVRTISSYAFKSCYSLASVVIKSKKLTQIQSYAFYECYSLASINIPSSVTTIDSYAFALCYSLASINIPSSVTTIGERVFYQCLFLKTITCKATTPPTLGSDAIPSNIETIYVPDSSISAYKSATNWSSFSSKIKGISEE